MTEVFTEIFLIIPMGFLAWAASKNFGIPGYSAQPIQKTELHFIPLAVIMSASYFVLIDPLLIKLITSVFPFVLQIKKFNVQQGPMYNLFGLILISDLLGYWIHRWLHGPLLWRFHALHHSPKHLNWLSGLLGTPIHYILIFSAMTISNAFFTLDSALGFLIFLSLFNIASQHFCHSNIRIPYSDFFEQIFITPRLHFLHHNPEKRFTNSNYGFYFSVWDRVFKTFRSPNDTEIKPVVGLDYDKSFADLFFGK